MLHLQLTSHFCFSSTNQADERLSYYAISQLVYLALVQRKPFCPVVSLYILLHKICIGEIAPRRRILTLVGKLKSDELHCIVVHCQHKRYNKSLSTFHAEIKT